MEPERTPAKWLIGVDVVFARDKRNGCAFDQRLLDSGALEFFGVATVGPAFRTLLD